MVWQNFQRAVIFVGVKLFYLNFGEDVRFMERESIRYYVFGYRRSSFSGGSLYVWVFVNFALRGRRHKVILRQIYFRIGE